MHLRITGVLATLAAVSMPACDTCSVSTAFDARATRHHGLIVGVAEQLTRYGTIRDGDDDVGNPLDQRLDSSITNLVLGWQFDERWGVAAVVPYIDRQYRRAGHYRVQTGNEDGLGDVAVVGHVAVLRRQQGVDAAIVTLHAGVELPTGDSGRLEEEAHAHSHQGYPDSAVHGHDLALGSGSVDVLFGASAYVQHRRFVGIGDAQYALRTEGDHGYTYGDSIDWRLMPGWLLLMRDDAALGLHLVIAGEHRADDETDAGHGHEAGLDAVYLGPALSGSWSGRLHGDAALQLPVHQRTDGPQLVADWRVVAAIVATF